MRCCVNVGEGNCVEFFKNLSSEVTNSAVADNVGKVGHNPLKKCHTADAYTDVHKNLNNACKVNIALVNDVVDCVTCENRNIERERNADDCTHKS